MELFVSGAIIAVGQRHARGINRGRPWALALSSAFSITFLVIILVLYLINMLPIDGRAKQIVRIIVIIIGVLSLLKYLAI